METSPQKDSKRSLKNDIRGWLLKFAFVKDGVPLPTFTHISYISIWQPCHQLFLEWQPRLELLDENCQVEICLLSTWLSLNKHGVKSNQSAGSLKIPSWQAPRYFTFLTGSLGLDVFFKPISSVAATRRAVPTSSRGDVRKSRGPWVLTFEWIDYHSFFHKHWSGTWLQLKGNYWVTSVEGTHFSLPWLLEEG